jgi:hypothetical protein
VAIDRRGEWFKGTEYADLVAYLRELQPGGYPVHRVVQAVCGCGTRVFRLLVDFDDELAKTVCCGCGREAFVSDAEEHWGDSSPEALKCPCGQQAYEVGLGLCIKDEEWVRWMSVGARCVSCGVLGSPVDWKSDLDVREPAATRIG